MQVLMRPLNECASSAAAAAVPPADTLAVFDEVVGIVQRCPVLQLMDLPQIVAVRRVPAWLQVYAPVSLHFCVLFVVMWLHDCTTMCVCE